MKRTLIYMMSCVTLITISGCAICCTPYFNDYPTYGGRVQRSDPQYGRVGSLFSDPYKAMSGPSADSNLETYEREPVDKRPEDITPEELPTPILDTEDNALPLPVPQRSPTEDRDTTKASDLLLNPYQNTQPSLNDRDGKLIQRPQRVLR